jgi:hypothetical protein
LQCEDVKERINSYVVNGNYNSVFIYGAAELGIALSNMIEEKTRIIGFIDQFIKHDSINGRPVFRMECCNLSEADLIIITPIHVRNEVADELKCHGFVGDLVDVSELL